jgi:hypothetical protein
MIAYVARNHNGKLVAWNQDFNTILKEARFYEWATDNETYIGKEEFDGEPVYSIH